jgi:hypothetical protein
VPIVIAGLLTDSLGLVTTVSWYTAVTVALAVVSLVSQVVLRRRENGLRVMDVHEALSS